MTTNYTDYELLIRAGVDIDLAKHISDTLRNYESLAECDAEHARLCICARRMCLSDHARAANIAAIAFSNAADVATDNLAITLHKAAANKWREAYEYMDERDKLVWLDTLIERIER